MNEPVKCDNCKRLVDADQIEVVTKLTAKANRNGPAEYDDINVCDDCRDRAEYLSDPFNAAYERARANGWSD